MAYDQREERRRVGKKTSVYLPDDVAAAVAASGVTMTDLVRRGLGTEGLTIRQAAQDAADAVREDIREIVRQEVRAALGDAQRGSL